MGSRYVSVLLCVVPHSRCGLLRGSRFAALRTRRFGALLRWLESRARRLIAGRGGHRLRLLAHVVAWRWLGTLEARLVGVARRCDRTRRLLLHGAMGLEALESFVACRHVPVDGSLVGTLDLRHLRQCRVVAVGRTWLVFVGAG